jgi:hypothetical protein
MLLRSFINLAFLLVFTAAFAQRPFQIYSFEDYHNDNKILANISRHIRNDNMDSLDRELRGYRSRLGFTYYQCKALIANSKSDASQLQYLDSAFMRGMTPLCLSPHLNKFDTAKVSAAFRKSYLRAYDLRLIYVIDSIHYKDQEYRQKIEYVNQQLDYASKQLNTSEGPVKKIKIQTKQEIVDSLWKLQLRTDSSNMATLKEMIRKDGWPGAARVGDYYCQRPAADITTMFLHLGNTQREFQIVTLKHVIELCKIQQDSWQNASSLMFGLHSKFSQDFSEFSFLQIEDGKINKEESFFSVYNMAEMMINAYSKKKIEIKCANVSLFNQLKQFMLSMNERISIKERDVNWRKEQGFYGPAKLEEGSFAFIESPLLNGNTILYRIVKCPQ